MKKILVVGMDNTLGGLNLIVLNLLNEIISNKDDFYADLLLPHGEIKFKDKINKNISIINNDISFINFYKYKNKIIDILNNNYDYIWINTSNACNLILLKTIRKNSNAKILVHSHNTGIDVKSKLKYIILLILHKINMKKFNKMIDVKFSCGEKAAKWLYGDCKNVRIISNGIYADCFKFDKNNRKKMRETLKINENTLVLIHVGRFMPVKNHCFLIDIIQELHAKRNIDFKLLLVGTGELENTIKQKVDDLKLNNYVSFLEDRNDIPNLLNASDIFLLPSLFEGFPVTLVEAQASGLPCIVSDTISEEVNILDLVTFTSIDNTKDWITKIENIDFNFSRELYFEKIKNIGYDIKSLGKTLAEFFYEN